MIPKYNESGVLPPFYPGSTPAKKADVAPYKTTLSDFAISFSITPHRCELLRGFLNYRKEIKQKGITTGFQWIDGSFTENVETLHGRSPSDIDVITFAERPSDINTQEEWVAFVTTNHQIFHPGITKLTYHCDAYYVDMSGTGRYLVSETAYWFGLFSHQRETFLWKGLLEIPLSDNSEDQILNMLNGVDSND